MTGKNPTLFMITTESEGSSRRAFSESHGFVYYPSAVKIRRLSYRTWIRSAFQHYQLSLVTGTYCMAANIGWISQIRVRCSIYTM